MKSKIKSKKVQKVKSLVCVCEWHRVCDVKYIFCGLLGGNVHIPGPWEEPGAASLGQAGVREEWGGSQGSPAEDLVCVCV